MIPPRSPLDAEKAGEQALETDGVDDLEHYSLAEALTDRWTNQKRNISHAAHLDLSLCTGRLAKSSNMSQSKRIEEGRVNETKASRGNGCFDSNSIFELTESDGPMVKTNFPRNITNFSTTTTIFDSPQHPSVATANSSNNQRNSLVFTLHNPEGHGASGNSTVSERTSQLLSLSSNATAVRPPGNISNITSSMSEEPHVSFFSTNSAGLPLASPLSKVKP